MKRLIIFLLTLCCVFAACNRPDYSETIAVPTVPETQAPTQEPTQSPTETPTKAPAVNTPTTLPVFPVAPLPATIDLSNVGDCTLAVSVKEGDAYVDDTGIMQMQITVYTYDLYDMVDIAMMGGSDSIIIRGEEVVIEALERTENGAVIINGGLDMGGYELRTDDDTVYYEIGYSDVKSWYELGQVTLRVSADFIYTDRSDLDRDPVTYYPGDFLTHGGLIDYGFFPDNTTVTVENGMIISMERVYTP